MKLPMQSKGSDRVLSTASISSNITAAQFQSYSLRTRRPLPIFRPPGGAMGVPPRDCPDCYLLFLICRAIGTPDATCVADHIECTHNSCF